MAVRAPAAPAASAAPAGSAAQDAPASALDVIQALLAVKLSQPLTVVKPDATIKALVGGKSAVQNEILGELEKEFGSGPDGGAEMPLTELAKAVGGSYKTLGKVSSALVTRMLGAKLPGGFGAADARSHLASKGLGPGRIDGVLVHALSSQPPARLAGAAEARAFLDAATDAYCAAKGVALGGAGGGGGGGAGGAGGAGGISPEMLAMLLGGGGGGGGSAGGGGGGGGGPVADAPASALEFMRVLLATKLNQPLAAVKPDATIKALVGGKSAVQNEILGELEKEFGSGPDGGAEMPLTELAKAVGGSYKALGKVSSALVTRMLGAKLPGGFGAADARRHLQAAKGLGPGRSDSVLLYGCAAPHVSGLELWGAGERDPLSRACAH